MTGGISIYINEGTLQVHSYSWLGVQPYSQARGIYILTARSTAILTGKGYSYTPG